MSNRRDLRTCNYSISYELQNMRLVTTGYFHTFTKDAQAIVEDVDTGHVVKCPADCIKFTDIQEQSDIHDMSTAD